MPAAIQSWPRRLAVAVLCAAGGLLLRVALDPFLHNTLALLTLFPAVAVAAWYAGYLPALLTAVLGYAGAVQLFESRGALPETLPDQIVTFVGFLLSCAVLVAVTEQIQSARRRAEASAEEASRQREWFRTTLGSIGDAVIAADPESRISFLNPVAEHLTGWSAAAAIGQPLGTVFKILNERTREAVENPGARALSDGVVVGLANHSILIARDGSERPIDDSAAPIRDADGELNGVVLVFRDVTARRKLEALQQDLQGQLERQVEQRTAELRQSEAQFRMLVEGTSGVAIFLLDAGGTVVSWNPGAEAIKGYRAEEIIGQHFSRFYPAEELTAGKPAHELRIAREQGSFAEESWRLRKDGSRFWASVLITALFDDAGTLRGFSKITTDRTLQMRAEEAARELAGATAAREEAERNAAAIQAQREHLRVTLHSIGDAVMATDVQGNITLLNALAAKLVGWPGDDAVGQPLTTVFRIRNEETGRSADNPVERVMREGAVIGLANHTVLIARDGTITPIDDSAAPIRDAAGKLLGVVLVFRDVTERRRAERAIRESEARKAAILESALDGVITMNHEGKVLEFNSAAERMFGFARAEVLGRELAKLIVPPALRERHRAGLARYLATGEGPVLDRRIEMPALRADGTEVPVELSITRIPNPGPPLFTAHVYDITERVKIERRRSARLAVTQVLAHAPSLQMAAPAILQALGDSLGWDAGSLWLIEPQDRLLRCETFWHRQEVKVPRFEQTTRESAFPAGVGLPGRVWSTGKPAWIPDVATDGNFPRAPVATAEGLHGAFAFPIGTGSEVFGAMEFFSAEVREPDPDLLELVTTLGGQVAQFMERRRAEQTAHFLADASASLAVLVDVQSTLQNVASLVVPFFADWCTIDLLGADGALNRVAAAQRGREAPPETAAQRRQSLDPNAPEGVWRVLRSGQSELLAASLRVPLRVRGRTVGVLSCLVAEGRPRYDATDLAVADDLARRIAIAMENASLYAELREADRKKDEFLAILSHELRNPLAPLGNALELLKRSRNQPAVREEAVAVMQRQLAQLVRLVDDLLDVSRITRNQPDLRREPVELASIVGSALETSRGLFERRGQQLSVTLPGEPVWLDADAVRLAQVFGNLLNNAAKYTSEGGRIALTAERRGEQVSVAVRDNGIGIPPELLPGIFEMFSQVDRSLERSHGGLGIGLSLVKRLVELHGGTVSASSAGPGQGSVFEVQLPVIAPPRSAAPPSPPAEPRARPARRILVVDDNRDAASSLAQVLELMGHETRVAFDGLAGLELAREFRPELVFLDIGLPKLNGYDTCRRLHQEPWGKAIRCIALTGWGQEEDKQRSRDAGFVMHLVKPVDPAALDRVLALPHQGEVFPA